MDTTVDRPYLEHVFGLRCEHCRREFGAFEESDPYVVADELVCWRCYEGLEYEAYERECDGLDALFAFFARWVDAADDVRWVRGLRRHAVCGELRSLAGLMASDCERQVAQ